MSAKTQRLNPPPTALSVATFSIATSERFKDKAGTWQDRTEWHNLVAYQRTAEIVRDYVKKGSKLYVEGRLQTSSWDDKTTGQKKYRTEIIVGDLSLLSGKGEGEGGSGGGYHARIQHRSTRAAQRRIILRPLKSLTTIFPSKIFCIPTHTSCLFF